MIRRRIWLRAIIVGTIGLLPWTRAFGQEGNSINTAEQLDERNIASLEDQLKNGLRVVTPEQMKFVKVVVAYVQQGHIPRAMVNLVYRWAIERNARIPFPYFQYAMQALSKRRGVTLPASLN